MFHSHDISFLDIFCPVKKRVTEDITGFAAVLYELLWQIAFAYTYELRYDDDDRMIWLYHVHMYNLGFF